MTIIPAREDHRQAIVLLLQTYSLPAADLPRDLTGFFVAIESNQVIGAIGLERNGHYGLLRSAVVHSAYRSQNIAGRLVASLEQYASEEAIQTIYLLTETAEGYFSRKGYQNTDRDKVPAEVRSASEFSYVCPASATLMMKQIAPLKKYPDIKA